MAEKMYDRICSRSDGGKRLAKRQNYLLAQNDLIEEQILQIETDRALHSVPLLEQATDLGQGDKAKSPVHTKLCWVTS
ncbi:unnamed protein product [Cladocopium goreaui]|uniref:Uncharacterized protein n=1 Tax=Cladocopium goreaui TaxID=2562237 RepID=A0A9P1C327_9DINO|nr:unnamed protein product [Cladocopium goreaui]